MEAMQTFVPYPDLVRGAAVLDDRRLGKQRVEVLQVVRALTRPTYGWKHHPAVRMWQGCEAALGLYAQIVCAEWSGRGFIDTCDLKIRVDLADAGFSDLPTRQEVADLPAWWGDEAVHRSHRSNLLRKDPEYYRSRFEADLPNDLDYVWPVPAVKPADKKRATIVPTQ